MLMLDGSARGIRLELRGDFLLHVIPDLFRDHHLLQERTAWKMLDEDAHENELGLRVKFERDAG